MTSTQRCVLSVATLENRAISSYSCAEWGADRRQELSGRANPYFGTERSTTFECPAD